MVNRSLLAWDSVPRVSCLFPSHISNFTGNHSQSQLIPWPSGILATSSVSRGQAAGLAGTKADGCTGKGVSETRFREDPQRGKACQAVGERERAVTIHSELVSSLQSHQ